MSAGHKSFSQQAAHTLGQTSTGAGIFTGESMEDSFRNFNSGGLSASLSANQNSTAGHPNLGRDSAGAGMFAGTSVGDSFQHIRSGGLASSHSANQNNGASYPTLSGQASAGAGQFAGTSAGNFFQNIGSHSAIQNNIASHPSLGQASAGAGLFTGSGAGDSVQNIGGSGLPASLSNQNSTGSQLSLDLLNLLVSQNPSLLSQLMEAANSGLYGSGAHHASTQGAHGHFGTHEDTKEAATTASAARTPTTTMITTTKLALESG